MCCCHTTQTKRNCRPTACKQLHCQSHGRHSTNSCPQIRKFLNAFKTSICWTHGSPEWSCPNGQMAIQGHQWTCHLIGRQDEGDQDRSRVHMGYDLGNQSEEPGYCWWGCEQLDYMWVIRLLELAIRYNPIVAGVEHRFGYESVPIDCIF